MKKDIDKLSPGEICSYLNTSPHRLPIILKHKDGYDFYSDKITKKNITLRQAYKKMKGLEDRRPPPKEQGEHENN